MIRRSAFVAALAILLSLGIHALGLSISAPNLTPRTGEDQRSDTVELGTTFEDFATAEPEPVEPELAEPPEPPSETPPEPVEAEIPTSDALVASAEPQQTPSPDTGASTVLTPQAPVPEAIQSAEQAGSDPQTLKEVAQPSPVEPVAAPELPDGTPNTGRPLIEAATPDEASAPAPEQIAALPAPPTIPLAPADSEITEPEELDVEPQSENSDLAVTTSIRPQPADRSQPEPQGAEVGSDKFEIFRNPQQTIVSPLAQYQQDGTDAFSSRNREARSGGRGPGNSDVTNYAGKVLVHLNRAPIVYVASKGFAQVFFEINPDGSLAWVDVVDSSGSREVDRAAKEQVRTAAPFPPPPNGASRKLSFFYQIN